MMRPFMFTLLALTAMACGTPFRASTPSAFVELDEPDGYDYRAIAPEGVAIAVRAIDLDGKGDLPFWVRATTLRMRQMNGYALLKETNIQSHDGTAGKELVFGHDEGGKPFLYTLRLFVAQGRLFVVEAGGPKHAFEQHKVAIDDSLSKVRVRCDSFLSPVLASRTCRKW